MNTTTYYIVLKAFLTSSVTSIGFFISTIIFTNFYDLLDPLDDYLTSPIVLEFWLVLLFFNFSYHLHYYLEKFLILTLEVLPIFSNHI